jgi:hypothetical protein
VVSKEGRRELARVNKGYRSTAAPATGMGEKRKGNDSLWGLGCSAWWHFDVIRSKRYVFIKKWFAG